MLMLSKGRAGSCSAAEVLPVLWGRQSCLQPPFQTALLDMRESSMPAAPAESRRQPGLAAPQSSAYSLFWLPQTTSARLLGDFGGVVWGLAGRLLPVHQLIGAAEHLRQGFAGLPLGDSHRGIYVHLALFPGAADSVIAEHPLLYAPGVVVGLGLRAVQQHHELVTPPSAGAVGYAKDSFQL